MTPVLLVGLLGFAISVTGITVPSVWYDEAATITSVTRSWPELWRMLGTVDAVHAAYYVVIHVIVDLFGYSPLAIRLPSAIATGVAAALVVVLVRQLSGPGHAVLAGIVFCAIPRATWMGTEGRSYALSTAFAVAVTIALVHAIRADRKRWWVLYVVVAALGSTFYIYLALLVVAHAVTVLWWYLSQRRRDLTENGVVIAPRAFLRFVVAGAVFVLSQAPLGIAIVLQSGQLSWIDGLSGATVRQVFRTQWFMFDYPFAIAAWVLMVLGVIVLVRRRHPLARIIIPALVVPTAALLVITAVYSPIYSPRYLTMTAPFVAMAMTALIVEIRPRLVGVIPLVLIVALAIPSAVRERMPQAKQNSTWSEVADLIGEERAAQGADSTTAIIYGVIRRHPSATARVIEYSYPDPFRGTVDVTLTTPAGEIGRLWEEHAPLADSLDRLEDADTAFLITSVTRDLRPETTETMASIGWEVTEEWNLGDVNVLRYERG